MTPSEADGVRRLLNGKVFAQIAELCRPSNTILGIFRDAFVENVLSRLLRFLCDSGEAHRLGDAFLRNWLKAVPGLPRLGQGRKSVSAIFNWQLTNEEGSNRYIDLVLIVRTRSSQRPQLVIGVEVKVNARESSRQVADYQAALIRRFPTARSRLLLFLTPDGRENVSGERLTKCPAYDVPYKAILDAAGLAAKDSAISGKTRVILEDLSEFLSRDIMKDEKKAALDRLIKKLESEEGSAEALNVLRGAKHPETIRTFVYEKLLRAIREAYGDVELEWHHPESSARPNEFNFRHADISDKTPVSAGFDLYYMLHSAQKQPTKGSEVSVLLMAHSGSGNRKLGPGARKRIDAIREKLPKSEGKRREWGPWACLWASDSHQLDKFTAEEAQKIAGLYLKAVAKTKALLLKSL